MQDLILFLCRQKTHDMLHNTLPLKL
ncbi:hypothetical protein [Escherichia phage dw-ec]|nr:hypothetical protein [Escherichia phage dw-ec]